MTLALATGIALTACGDMARLPVEADSEDAGESHCGQFTATG